VQLIRRARNGNHWHDGCTNLIPFPIHRLFHLTITDVVFVLRPMSVPQTTRKEDTAKSPAPSWLGLGALSWRKVATVAAAVVALALGYHVVFGQNGLTAYQQKRQEARALNQQLQSLQRENELLKGHVDRLQDDPNAIEHQAREELHYTRPGEVIYTMPEAPPAKPH
jgi:cell division protein FtsB